MGRVLGAVLGRGAGAVFAVVSSFFGVLAEAGRGVLVATIEVGRALAAGVVGAVVFTGTDDLGA